MLIRSLTLATLLAFVGPSFAADDDSPLVKDVGRARPLIVIAPSSVDPVWLNLKKSLDDSANRKGFTDRNMVLYTVINTMGQRDGKDLDPQSTMATIMPGWRRGRPSSRGPRPPAGDRSRPPGARRGRDP